VNVLTHTISDVSQRLTTASEALDARYLRWALPQMAQGIHGGICANAALCMLLLGISSSMMRAKLLLQAGARTAQDSSAGQGASCSTVNSYAPAAGVKAQVINVRRLAMANDGLHVLKRGILEHLQEPAPHLTLRIACDRAQKHQGHGEQTTPLPQWRRPELPGTSSCHYCSTIPR
jgi:hypothetical protein